MIKLKSNNKNIDVYEAYENIKEIGWNHFTFSYDTKSGFEAVAYYRQDVLTVGISGTDRSYADWIDNDARLFIPKGGLIPTQFNVVKRKLLGIINKYRFKFSD